MDKDLKRLKRVEILEIMLAQSKEIDRLRARNAELEQALENKQIILANAGSLAEASLKLTRIFEEAQKAADLYLTNIQNTQRE